MLMVDAEFRALKRVTTAIARRLGKGTVQQEEIFEVLVHAPYRCEVNADQDDVDVSYLVCRLRDMMRDFGMTVCFTPHVPKGKSAAVVVRHGAVVVRGVREWCGATGRHRYLFDVIGNKA